MSTIEVESTIAVTLTAELENELLERAMHEGKDLETVTAEMVQRGLEAGEDDTYGK